MSNEADADGVAGTQSFCDMYTTLPDKMSKTMSKNLSIPIAFVCLLHLCNEKVKRRRMIDVLGGGGGGFCVKSKNGFTNHGTCCGDDDDNGSEKLFSISW